MANVRRSRAGGYNRAGKSRRESFWVGILGTSTALVSGTPVLFTGFSAAVLALRPFTIVRSRGWLSISTDQAIASEDFAGALAFAVVSDQALAIGVTAVPTPVADIDSDLWFVYEKIGGRVTAVTSTGISGSLVTKPFDSRAMRKVEDGQDVAILEESETGFDGAVMQKGGRMLIKLH